MSINCSRCKRFSTCPFKIMIVGDLESCPDYQENFYKRGDKGGNDDTDNKMETST